MTFSGIFQNLRPASRILLSVMCVGGVAGCDGIATGTSSVNPERTSEVISLNGYSFEIVTESYVDETLYATTDYGMRYHPTITTMTVFTPDGQRQK